MDGKQHVVYNWVILLIESQLASLCYSFELKEMFRVLFCCTDNVFGVYNCDGLRGPWEVYFPSCRNIIFHPEVKKEFSVGTLLVDNKFDPEAVGQVIFDQDADIWCLQSVSEDTFNALQISLAVHGFAGVCQPMKSSGHVIFYQSSRFVLMKQESVELEELILWQTEKTGANVGVDFRNAVKNKDSALMAKFYCRITKKQVILLNVRLGTGNDNLNMKAVELCALLRLFEPTDPNEEVLPFFLCGHLGIGPNDPEYNALFVGTMTDEWKADAADPSRRNVIFEICPEAYTHSMRTLESVYQRAYETEALTLWDENLQLFKPGDFILHLTSSTSLDTILDPPDEGQNVLKKNLPLWAVFEVADTVVQKA